MQILIGIDIRDKNVKQKASSINRTNNVGVFTTLHLPEYQLKEQLAFLNNLCKILKNKLLMVDISYNNFLTINQNNNLFKIFKPVLIDWLRLDVGFSPSLLAKYIKRNGNIKGICINASTSNNSEINNWIQFCQQRKIKICACHNYYPKPYTGLSIKKIDEIQHIFNTKKVEVWGFVSNASNGKPPLKEGLPTIEDLRFNSLKENLLIANNNNNFFNNIIIADYVSQNEILEINELIINKNIVLRLKPTIKLSHDLIKILNVKHYFRNDTGDYLLRSYTSRSYAQFGHKVLPTRQIKRAIGSITIDNVLFKRYSGELCIVKSTLPKDKRVNVIGTIHKDDKKLIKYINEQYSVTFKLI